MNNLRGIILILVTVINFQIGFAQQGTIYAIDYLPSGPSLDMTGTVADYTVEMQNAIDAAANKTLILPDFPVKVSQRTDEIYCLKSEHPLHIIGTRNSELKTLSDDTMILFIQDLPEPGASQNYIEDVLLDGFRVRGPGGEEDTTLGKGLIQINYVNRVEVRGLEIIGSQVDGIAISNGIDVLVTGNLAVDNAKASIYVNGSKNVTVTNNTVRDFGGYNDQNGGKLGTGMSISHNQYATVANNAVYEGDGVGIMIYSNENTRVDNYIVTGNRVWDVKNTNPAHAAGISFTSAIQGIDTDGDGDVDEEYKTSVAAIAANNLVRNCGDYNYYFSGGDGILVTDNLGMESRHDNMKFYRVTNAVIDNNYLIDTQIDTPINSNPAIKIFGESDGTKIGDNHWYARFNNVQSNDVVEEAYGRNEADNLSNGGVHDGLPTFSRLVGPQGISNGTWQKVKWTTQIHNPLGMWPPDPDGPGPLEPVLDHITVPDGVSKIRITASAVFDYNTTGQRALTLFRFDAHFNGAPESRITASGVNSVSLDSGIIDVSPGQQFSVVAYQNSGGTLSLLANERTWVKVEVW